MTATLGRLSLCALVALGAFALAGTVLACEPLGSDELELAGVGIATFGSFSYSSQEDRAELYGGVCIHGDGGFEGVGAWTLAAQRVIVSSVSERPVLEAEDSVLRFEGWRLSAEALLGDAESLTLYTVAITGETAHGIAEAATYDVATGRLLMTAVSVEDARFRISADRGELIGGSLIFEEAWATTCICNGGELYVIAAPEARVDLERETLLLRGGEVHIGGMAIALAEEVVVTEATLTALTLPLVVEYVADDPAAGRTGTGLGVIVPQIALAPGVGLELGVTGLDLDYPLDGVLLLHVDEDQVEATLGKAREGFQADVLVKEPLNDWLEFQFGVRNRHWASADFLHDGYVALRASGQVPGVLGADSLRLEGGAIAAASSQVLNDRVVGGPRLVLGGRSVYRTPPTLLGRATLDMSAEVGYYPVHERLQYGVRLRPSWRGSAGPLEYELAFDRMFTNSASPFSPRLDRREETSVVEGRVGVAGPVTETVSAAFALRGRYDLLGAGGKGRLRALGFDAHAAYETLQFTVVPRLQLELAARFQPEGRTPSDIQAFLAAGVDISVGEWEFAVAMRHNLRPQAEALERFEGAVSFPIHTGDVTLRPFVAVDFVPTLRDSVWPRISGHGLELEWRSCCGTIVIGYRQHDNRFSTSFGVRLNDDR